MPAETREAHSARSSTAAELLPARRRPRDRRQQIVASAAKLVIAHGYPRVSMAMIAERVGITASALYRHFRDKQDLLRAVFDSEFEFLAFPPPSDTWDVYVDFMVEFSDRHPAVGALWFREIRNLPQADRARLRERLRAWSLGPASLVSALRPEADPGQLELVMWGLTSVTSSPYSRFRTAAAADRRAGMRAAMNAVAHAPLEPSGPVIRQRAPRVPSARSERLILAAIEHFGRYGYEETSMTSIGTAADVTGPNIYGYFDSKADLLRVVLDRGRHVALHGLSRALADSSSAAEALVRLVDLQQELPAVWTRWIIEPGSEDDAPRPYRDAERDYIAEWTRLLREVDPDLSADAAGVRVGIALTILSDLGQTPSVARRSSFSRNVRALARAVIFDGPHPAERAADAAAQS